MRYRRLLSFKTANLGRVVYYAGIHNEYKWSKLERIIKLFLPNFLILEMGKVEPERGNLPAWGYRAVAGTRPGTC